MGVYKRKLKKGIRWRFGGQHLGVKYFSKAIYYTRQDALKAEREKINETERELINPKIEMKLRTLMEKRLDYLFATKSQDYYKENRRYFKKALSVWGDIEIRQVSKQMVNDLLLLELKRLESKGKSNHKINSMLRSLKALFNRGNKIYDLGFNNPSNLDFYPIKINLKHIPSDEEIDTIKSICSPEQVLLIEFVEQTGCRIMKAIRFKYEDIDNDLITLWTRKSKNSNFTPRRIPIPPCLIGKTGKGKVFKQWQEHPRFVGDKIKKLGFKKWNWHNLRQRRASIWASQKMPPIEIMSRLGHSNLQTTMKYLQLLTFTKHKG